MPGPEWHWEQGTKYVVEGVKSLTILNGGAAIALMTFGNAHSLTLTTILSLGCFALGAAASVFIFFVGYRAQLSYGNAEQEKTQGKKMSTWRKGQWWNNFAYLFLSISLAFFVIGLFLAATGLPRSG